MNLDSSHDNRPHVESIEEGNRSVEHLNFDSPEELGNYLLQFSFLDIGSEALLFVDKPLSDQPVTTLKLDRSNPLGKEWNISLAQELLARETNSSRREKLEKFIAFVQKRPDKLLDPEAAAQCQRRIRETIAAHNAYFRAHSSLTPPVNQALTYHNYEIGFFRKFLDGLPAAEGDLDSEELNFLTSVTMDGNPSNLIKNIPADTSTSPNQIIDIGIFKESSGIEVPDSIKKKLLGE